MIEWTGYDQLYHHGILGQRWGKRNGPPYPLSRSRMSDSEKSKKRKVSGSSGSGKESTKNKLKSFSFINKKDSKKVVKEKNDNKNVVNNDSPEPEKKKVGKFRSDVRKEARKKNINELSNKELREANERMRLEQEYIRLRRSKGEQFVLDLANNVTRDILKNTLTREGQAFVNKELDEFKKEFKDFRELHWPKKDKNEVVEDAVETIKEKDE